MRSCYPPNMLRTYLRNTLLCTALAAPLPAYADEADAEYRKGLASMQAGQYQEAQVSLEKAIALRPNYAAAELTLGNTLKKMKKCDQAVAHYEKVIRLEPASQFAYGNLGFCYAQLNRKDEAIRTMERAVELSPNEVQWRMSLGTLHRQKFTAMMQAAPAGAKPSGEKAPAVAGGSPSDSMTAQQHIEHACTHLKKAIELDPNNPDALRNYAVALRQAKQLDEAARITQRAIELLPNDSNLRFDLAVIYRVQQKTPEAIKAYQEAVKLDDRNADAWYDLGVLYQQERQKDEAIKALNRYIDLAGPNGKGVAGVKQQIQGLGGTPH